MKKMIINIGVGVVALLLSAGGLYFTIKGQWHESSTAWNSAAIVLWLGRLIS